METVVVILSALLVGSILVIGVQQAKISSNKEEYELNLNTIQASAAMYRRLYYAEMRNNLNKSNTTTTKVVREVPKDTLQAVKLAMKLSHPDNGGKEADFIMYRRAYNIITGKEKP